MSIKDEFLQIKSAQQYYQSRDRFKEFVIENGKTDPEVREHYSLLMRTVIADTGQYRDGFIVENIRI